ncbi:MAG: biotin/lipoyl-binding protein [Prevotella sp.]|nr:biotin/lipoyl-binding protein [Prevotella sp.]
MKKYEYKVQGVDYEVEITEVEGKIAKVNVNGIPFEIEMQKPINAAKHPELAAIRRTVATPNAPEGATAAPATPSPAPKVQATPAAPAGAGSPIKAPLPGTITEVKVAVGQQVSVGEPLLVLEAMKMQNNIEAETTGQVTSILVNKGDTVMEGTVLLTIA